MATFDQLPFDIVDEILSYNPQADTLSLAKVCKWFNALALFPFSSIAASENRRDPFQRNSAAIECGLWPHKAPKTLPPSANTFTGLSLVFAPELLSIDTLNISFQTCSLEHHFDHVTKNLHRLLRIVNRLYHVRKVSITFNYTDLLVVRRDFRIDATHDLEERKKVTAELLNAVLERGCEELAVYRSSFMPRFPGPGELRLLTGIQRLKFLVFGSASGPGLVLGPYLFTGNPIQLPSAIRQSCKLKKLEICGVMLLCPPLSSWTYDVLETPTLTSLTLNRVYMDKAEWEVALAWLYYPLRHQLLELAIENCYMLPIQALVNFFSKMKNITHFRLVVAGPVPKQNSSGNTIFFPKLVSTITAPISWIQFLCPETISRPDLRYINVNCARFEFGQAAGHLKALLNPSFSFQNQAQTDGQRTPREVEIVLDMKTGYNAKDLREDFSRYGDPQTRKLGFEAYDRVTTLWCNYNIVPVEDLVMFCQFLGWWKHLQTVRIIVLLTQLPRTWPQNMIPDLLQNARVHCPGVRKFIIHDVVYCVHEG